MDKAEMEQPEPEHHAILIGVNCYQDSPLKGAVSDVQAIQDHLFSTVPSAHLHTLTATESEDPDTPGPTEDPKDWPTVWNVIQTLKKVTAEAKAGDSVYIHFSGHGSTKNENKSDKSLQLVLIDDSKQNRCLKGPTLAILVNQMAEKGIFVTLVLDCCFSGNVVRGERLRFLPYNPKYEIAPPLEIEPALDKGSAQRSSRDVDDMSQFIIKHPDRHAIIVASGPNQKAVEAELDVTKQVHGRLSLFLLTTLKSERSIYRSIREVYDRVSFHFRQHELTQHPVLYGNERQAFFGEGAGTTLGRSGRMVYDASFYEVHSPEEGKFTLRAGTCQAVRDGDEFTLYPSSQKYQLEPVVARVTKAGNFSSEIEQVGGTLDLKNVEWRAVVRLQGALRQCPIKLASDLPELQKWEEELKKRSLDTYTKESSPTFFLKLDMKDEYYVIRDISGQEVLNVPTMDVASTTIEEVSGILEHLSRFRLVQSLSNHETPDDFMNSFEASVTVFHEPHDDKKVIKTYDQKSVELVVSNNGDHDLYVSIYNLGPQWDVANIGREAYYKIAPKKGSGYPKTLHKKLKLEVPDAMKETHMGCDDILKVFVTSHPAWMYNLQLPKLRQFPALTEGQDRYPANDDVPENWAVKNFRFRTEVPSSIARGQPGQVLHHPRLGFMGVQNLR